MIGVPSKIASMLFVITQQRLLPSIPVSSTAAFIMLSSLKVGTAESNTGLSLSATNGPTKLVAPLTLFTPQTILFKRRRIASGITSRTIISKSPCDWLSDWLVTGMAIPIRSGAAVILLKGILVSLSSVPSPANSASTISYIGQTKSPAKPVGIGKPTLSKIKPSCKGFKMS